MLDYSFWNFFNISPNAGLVMNTPTEIPIIVVIANPFNSPAPAHINGSNETNVVKYAPKMIVNALFSLCFRLNTFWLVSSIKMIKSSIPVPIVAKIPAIPGRSRFHLINAAIPKTIDVFSYDRSLTSSDFEKEFEVIAKDFRSILARYKRLDRDLKALIR